MKKFLSVLMAILLMVTAFAACKKQPEKTPAEPVSNVETNKTVDTSKVKLATLMGPTGMGMAYMLDKYDYTLCASPDEITGKLVSGDFDIAALPTNAAATLYNKTNGKIKLLALNTECVLYILEKGDTIKSVADLKGKTIYVSGQGSTPEYVLNYILENNGLEVGKDVKLDFTYATHNDLVAFAATGKADVVMLPEPTVTALLAKNKDMRVALSVDELYTDTVKDTDFKGSKVAMGCVAVNTAFADANPDIVAQFLKDYEDSVKHITDEKNIDAVSEKIAEWGIVPAAGVAKSALPRCRIIFKTGDEMKTEVEGFLKVLADANPSSVGGKMPDAAFYYSK